MSALVQRVSTALAVILSSLLLTWSWPALAATVVHRVQPGESLWLLSRQFGASIAEISSLNGLKDTVIYPGQELRIPVPDGSPGAGSRYVVRPGDSLYLIAQAHGTTVTELMRLNRLSSTEIWAGQALLVPAASPLSHVVQRGDTLYLIGVRYGVTTGEIMAANGLTNTAIYPGQRLAIPSPGGAGPGNQPGVQVTLHRVLPGETLSEIAYRYRSTVNAIYATNHLHSITLMPGQPLYVPVDSTTPIDVAGPRAEARPGFGELLVWQDARWIYNPGATATVTDLATGRTFTIKHLGGSNHADSEPLASRDTAVMKEIWGGNWSWVSRPVILQVGTRRLAASMAGMPHSVENIYDNGVAGHFDVYFLNSTSHADNAIVPEHQANVRRAAGY